VVDTKLSEDDNSGSVAFSALIITIICIICPIRSIIFHLKKEVEEESNTAYKDMALSFPSDYDKENPLTM